ncbi:MAG: AMP-binding protein [Candidatus Rokubacteria bacterium]|nr:AMP-binding protein [Candidatus Rokubacteria bacterium]
MSGSSALPLGEMLDLAAERQGDTPAIVFKGARVTYRELRERADRFARGLLGLGLGPGDHVVLWMPNSIEWNIANFAVAKIGAVTVTCNSRYKAFEVEYLLRQSDARALVMVDRFDAAGVVDYLEILREVCPDVLWRQDRVLRSAGFPELRHVIVLGKSRDPGCLDWAEVERLGARVPPGELGRIRVASGDPVEMLYTSGTTGAPKGCLLSHENFWYKARVYLDLHGWTAEDRCLVPVPYFHIFGALGCIVANTLAGSTQVLMEVFEPEAAMRLIQDERVTVFSGVPTMFITVLGHPRFKDFDLRSLRTGTIGAAPVPIEMMRRILDREGGLGMDATVVYGLTEATGGTHFTRLGDPLDKRVATVGRATPELADRVVDPVTGRERAAGEEGELCVRGPTLMLGYYKRADATAEKIRDSWLHTGDMAVKDADGYVRITGRLTDMIIVGGFNTYPAEIEDFYLRHAKILDVSIVGVPDPVLGEVPMAFVIPRAGESLTADEVIEFGRGRIANFKVPRHVEIVGEFPLTGSGKVQKFKQRAWAVETYGFKGPA